MCFQSKLLLVANTRSFVTAAPRACVQAVAAAAAATNTAAAMQQQSGDNADFQRSPLDTQAAAGAAAGGGISSLDSRLAKNRRPTGQDGPAGAGKAAADDWGAEPLGEDLLPM